MVSAGYAGSALAQTDRAITLNDRLNKVSEGLQYQCARIEGVLNRVHGAPTPIKSGGESAAVAPTLPLATTVDHLEAVLSRLSEIAAGTERIA